MSADDFWPREPGEFIDARAEYLDADREARRLAAELGVAAPSGELRAAAELSTARAGFMSAYAGLVERTRAELTAVAARTTIARLEARTGAPPGDPAAEQAADLADLRGRAEAEEAAEAAQSRSAELAAGHGAALGGFAPMTAMMGAAARGGGGGLHRSTHYDVPSSAPTDLDLRLRELCAGLDGPARDWARLAVAAVTDEAGRPWKLIGTTELDGYLRPGIVLLDGELAAGNEAWPELSIATFCAAHGFAPGPVVGAVEPPPEVCDHLRALGFEPSWASDAWDSSSWEHDDASLR
ncbi:putative protein OS=Tsukamurella paurometabola (strain ATCC 8368 / DSM / CCUG 35730 /CIP 100753 / JCM 10117 / KCTC 9821 / NBRC 16120 / NCIMB 702349/ NCTC 13040) OX=521096 GN=Tpau_1626 PE=4 SV=1 [Tsukamurella paurometabola]|uniref:Uncharacterized protein n=1 Tax=Tsukamurella paurometabola (strain ATCC 8368 / DSM 20162 / CCUG 35730 / CIP 100753 / JCM 10117 / KCTC 9821 / NBRC 16120 / NCIMB 702349 / NCTC 13040) TaxID=521096 RepID=D5UYE0_TSUPD|nr:hypothetical protein [Tsukamurella paurometabola]ADG78247.1 hypothetical protein Tpau_1626 [Tsukamurella paurometabola DSM 20162]SUP30859.1 Uncharacterised protein [Tsukamurella paurometabola]